jgi:hypothetical protein
MMVLQERLEASDSAVLYEEVAGGTSEIRPLKQRVADVVGAVWPAEALKLWGVPEQRVVAAGTLTEEQKHEFSRLLRPLDSPFERDSFSVGNLAADPGVDESKLSDEELIQAKLAALEKLIDRSDSLFGKASRRLLLARLSQVMGNFDLGMIQDLQQIRIACLQERVELNVPIDGKRSMVIPFVLPKSILEVQQNAIGDALYWTAMSQMSRSEWSAAVATLRTYRRQFPKEKSLHASLLNEAEALIRMDDLPSAAAVLKEADVDENPDRISVQWLLARLNAQPPAVPVPGDSATPESSADPQK